MSKKKKYAIEEAVPQELQHTVKGDIISVLNNSIQAILKGELGVLREESDHIIHCSAIFQRQESIQTAVVIYALAKILERGKTVDDRPPAGLVPGES